MDYDKSKEESPMKQMTKIIEMRQVPQSELMIENVSPIKPTVSTLEAEETRIINKEERLRC